MAVKSAAFGGADHANGSILVAGDWNDTFNQVSGIIGSAASATFGNVVLFPFNYNKIISGAWTFESQGTTSWATFVFTNTNVPAQNDQLDFKVGMDVGSYGFRAFYNEGTNVCWIKIDVGGSNVGSFDNYNAGVNKNKLAEVGSPFVNKTAGLKTISVYSNTKNAASTSFGMLLHTISIWRWS